MGNLPRAVLGGILSTRREIGMTHVIRLLTLVLALSVPGLAAAQVVLTAIHEGPDGADVETEYTFEELSALPQTEVTTDNDYVEEVTTFSGPRVIELFEEGAIEAGDELVLTALNDYSVTVPAADVLDYEVILAILMNGERMSVREKGPVWVIYPMDDNPELQEASYNDRLIWQLAKIRLQ